MMDEDSMDIYSDMVAEDASYNFKNELLALSKRYADSQLEVDKLKSINEDLLEKNMKLLEENHKLESTLKNTTSQMQMNNEKKNAEIKRLNEMIKIYSDPKLYNQPLPVDIPDIRSRRKPSENSEGIIDRKIQSYGSSKSKQSTVTHVNKSERNFKKNRNSSSRTPKHDNCVPSEDKSVKCMHIENNCQKDVLLYSKLQRNNSNGSDGQVVQANKIDKMKMKSYFENANQNNVDTGSSDNERNNMADSHQDNTISNTICDYKVIPLENNDIVNRNTSDVQGDKIEEMKVKSNSGNTNQVNNGTSVDTKNNMSDNVVVQQDVFDADIHNNEKLPHKMSPQYQQLLKEVKKRKASDECTSDKVTKKRCLNTDFVPNNSTIARKNECKTKEKIVIKPCEKTITKKSKPYQKSQPTLRLPNAQMHIDVLYQFSEDISRLQIYNKKAKYQQKKKKCRALLKKRKTTNVITSLNNDEVDETILPGLIPENEQSLHFTPYKNDVQIHVSLSNHNIDHELNLVESKLSCLDECAIDQETLVSQSHMCVENNTNHQMTDAEQITGKSYENQPTKVLFTYEQEIKEEKLAVVSVTDVMYLSPKVDDCEVLNPQCTAQHQSNNINANTTCENTQYINQKLVDPPKLFSNAYKLIDPLCPFQNDIYCLQIYNGLAKCLHRRKKQRSRKRKKKKTNI